MNKKSKLIFACGFTLLMLTVSTQQNVKADTTNDAQTSTNVQSSDNQTVTGTTSKQQPISEATQESTSQIKPSTYQEQSVQSRTNTQTDNQPDASSEQSNENNSNVQQNGQVNDQNTIQKQTNNQNNNPVVSAGTDQPTDNQTSDSQGTITPIKGVVTTNNNQITYLYRQDGSRISNRGLGANSPWYTDQKLDNDGETYYRVATGEFANGKDVVLSFGSAANGTVRVQKNGATGYERQESGFSKLNNSVFDANSTWKYNRTDYVDGLTYYQIASNVWINSIDATTSAVYQNPSGWIQIQNTQIKPNGGVGYYLYNGVEGIKTWLVRRYFGYSNAHTIYDGSVANSVRGVQRNAGLPVTGVVDLATWQAMGFSESSWYGIDSYIAPLRTSITSTRADHIEAMISEAYKYIGKPWISGASSSPNYGVDCSGLVTQSLYASGIDSSPVTSIQHAQPGNEWNCQLYWSDSRIHQVNYGNRQRGDLIFFSNPANGSIWHMGILLDANTMIESWPFAVQVHSIYSGRGNIVGVKRVFA
ncbi:peptidoglycan-binding protein [Companilactobacillus halodurans]|uniref:Peptidase n=1 Tax=Companilactobacillus halodurans TaxID=2584183 RepID=A0A5P0ZUV5_9LACO|nr:NlpC/P60 family protein [Companilactobacillus halodurans]MQS76417.1 peptidase [Companilactobacillus halodurans]MQS96819.1 peptidase [Companilactobacillus halodurans]